MLYDPKTRKGFYDHMDNANPVILDNPGMRVSIHMDTVVAAAMQTSHGEIRMLCAMIRELRRRTNSRLADGIEKLLADDGNYF